MRKPFYKLGLSVALLTAVLFSVLKFNFAYGETTAIDQSHQLVRHSQNNHTKVFTNNIITSIEFAVEDGESLDDEADETDEILATVHPAQCWNLELDVAEVGTTTKSLVSKSEIEAKSLLALFIVFRNFRL